LHHREVGIACPNFDVVFDAQSRNHGVWQGHRDAVSSQARKIIADRDPEWIRQGNEVEVGKVGQQLLPMC